MYNIKIDFDLNKLSDTVYSQIDQAVRETANEGYALWLEAVRRANIPHDVKVIYTQSIDMGMVGEFKAELWTDYDKAAEIENGQPARDLKTMLQTSKKTRMSKKGLKYLIIPFRHNTPGNDALAAAMPDHVYAEAKQLTKSRILSMGVRTSATGDNVPQNSYQWGGRLQAGLAPKAKEQHKTDLYAGMVRFDTGSGSAYMTFRTMSDKSNGWIVPAKPGLKIAEGVANQLEGILAEKLSKIGDE